MSYQRMLFSITVLVPESVKTDELKTFLCQEYHHLFEGDKSSSVVFNVSGNIFSFSFYSFIRNTNLHSNGIVPESRDIYHLKCLLLQSSRNFYLLFNGIVSFFKKRNVNYPLEFSINFPVLFYNNDFPGFEKEFAAKGYKCTITADPQSAMVAFTMGGSLSPRLVFSELYFTILEIIYSKKNHSVRHEVVMQELRLRGCRSLLDLGCGSGQFIQAAKEYLNPGRITGFEIDITGYRESRKITETMDDTVTAIFGAIEYPDGRFEGHDAAILIEVVEHLDTERLRKLEETLFSIILPRYIFITTPDRDFNIYMRGLTDKGLRHTDHRFEWSSREICDWAANLSGNYDYSFQWMPIGRTAINNSTFSQLVIFEKKASDPVL